MASKEIGMRIEGERKGVGLELLLGHRAFGVTPLKKMWGKDMWAETERLKQEFGEKYALAIRKSKGVPMRVSYK